MPTQMHARDGALSDYNAVHFWRHEIVMNKTQSEIVSCLTNEILLQVFLTSVLVGVEWPDSRYGRFSLG
jgi:hypothetical protein